MSANAGKQTTDNSPFPYHNARPCSIQEIQQANLSPEEKLIRSRQRARECAAIRRAFLPSEKLAMERKRGREYMALKRAFMTPEERALENQKNRERVRIKRMNLPEEKKEEIRKQQRERVARKRREMAPEKLMQVREKSRLRMQTKRALIPPEEKMRLKAIKREKAREYPPLWPPNQAFNFHSEPKDLSFSSQSQSSSSVIVEEVVPELPVFPSPLTDKTDALTVQEDDRHGIEKERAEGVPHSLSKDNGEGSAEEQRNHTEVAQRDNSHD